MRIGWRGENRCSEWVATAGRIVGARACAVRLNDFEIKITSTSASLLVVGFGCGVTLALVRVSRRGEEGGERLPLVSLLRRKSAEDGTDDDRDPIWQQTATSSPATPETHVHVRATRNVQHRTATNNANKRT